jgi:hypothetical protein
VKIFMVEVDRVVLRVANVPLWVNVRSGKWDCEHKKCWSDGWSPSQLDRKL